MNAGRHFSTDQLAIPSSKTGIWGTRPLPARLAQQQGETDLDDGGELTGEVPVEWIPNQASHGFLAWAEDPPGRQGLRRWNDCEKMWRAVHSGVYAQTTGQARWIFRRNEKRCIPESGRGECNDEFLLLLREFPYGPRSAAFLVILIVRSGHHGFGSSSRTIH